MYINSDNILMPVDAVGEQLTHTHEEILISNTNRKSSGRNPSVCVCVCFPQQHPNDRSKNKSLILNFGLILYVIIMNVNT